MKSAFVPGPAATFIIDTVLGPIAIRAAGALIRQSLRCARLGTVKKASAAPGSRALANGLAQARVANFRAHQQRFNRERAEYFSATVTKLRAAIENVSVADPSDRTPPRR